MAVGADAEATLGGEEVIEREATVPQVRFGGGAKARNRTAPRERAKLRRAHVGRVHEAPPGIDEAGAEQVLDRVRAGRGLAVAHLALLLRDVDVDGARAGRRGDCIERRARRRAQAMQRNTGRRERGVARAQVVDEPQERGRVVGEAPLHTLERLAVEVALLVERRQEELADAGAVRARADRIGERGGRCIRRARGLVMQVVELGDAGVARFQHLEVGEGGDRGDVLGGQALDEPVHDVAPAPEGVLGAARDFRAPGHRALECMAVQVRHAGEREARDQPLGARRHPGRLKPALGIDRDDDIAVHAIRQQGAFEA